MRRLCDYSAVAPPAYSFLQILPDLNARLVELRFCIPNRAAQQLRDFMVLISFDVVQEEDQPIPIRKLRDNLFDSYSIYSAIKSIVKAAGLIVGAPAFILVIRVSGCGHFVQARAVLPDVHQHNVDRDAMQPG